MQLDEHTIVEVIVVGIAHHFVDDPLIGVEIIGEAGVALK